MAWDVEVKVAVTDSDGRWKPVEMDLGWQVDLAVDDGPYGKTEAVVLALQRTASDLGLLMCGPPPAGFVTRTRP